MSKSSLYQKLSKIQQALKVPKGQYNSFGKYNYRNCEDILEALKPFLGEELLLTLSDELQLIGDRYYVKATATLYDVESGDTLCTTAFAREEEGKKGMDGSQITGSSSSYARKYALNGMFSIDDTKDSDTTNQNTGQNTGRKPNPITYQCEACGRSVTATPKLSVQEIIEKSNSRYGQQLCYTCIRARLQEEKKKADAKEGMKMEESPC